MSLMPTQSNMLQINAFMTILLDRLHLGKQESEMIGAML